MKYGHDANVRSNGGLLLAGLDGSNPLGFLAALGLFKVVGRHAVTAPIQMAWTISDSKWVPELRIVGTCSLDETGLLMCLDDVLIKQRTHHPAYLYDELSQIKAEDRRCFFEKQCFDASAGSRARVDFLAAIASDVADESATNQVQTTRRDYHLSNIDAILERTTKDHLLRAVFRSWDYADSLDNQSLHLDPGEDRRHAYQWNQPSGDPDRKRRGGILGANRLALEAFELLTSVPYGKRLITTGFTGTRSDDTRWTWPLWSCFISLSYLQSLLALKDLQDESFSAVTRQTLRERGIVAVFRSQRILVQKTPNFTPAIRVA